LVAEVLASIIHHVPPGALHSGSNEVSIHSDSSSSGDVNAEVSPEAVTPCDGGERKDNVAVPSGLDEMSASTTLHCTWPGKDGSQLNVEASLESPTPMPVSTVDKDYTLGDTRAAGLGKNEVMASTRDHDIQQPIGDLQSAVG
jgi:hypothetical protein